MTTRREQQLQRDRKQDQPKDRLQSFDKKAKIDFRQIDRKNHKC